MKNLNLYNFIIPEEREIENIYVQMDLGRLCLCLSTDAIFLLPPSLKDLPSLLSPSSTFPLPPHLTSMNLCFYHVHSFFFFLGC